MVAASDSDHVREHRGNVTLRDRSGWGCVFFHV